jgi:DNA-binding GntR family transcriptional regulator
MAESRWGVVMEKSFPTELSIESIHTQVTNALRKSIVSGYFRPGEKLSETSLAQLFGVSRTPVREALKQLQREGLVEVIPRVGTCVTKPTEKEINELFTVKEVLEGLAAALLSRRGDVPELVELAEATKDLEDAVQKGNIDLYVDANDRFHGAIMRGSDNKKLQDLFQMSSNQLPYSRYVYLTLSQPQRLKKSLDEHRQIYEAIKSGEDQKAERFMREHVRASADKLREGLAKKLIEMGFAE